MRTFGKTNGEKNRRDPDKLRSRWKRIAVFLSLFVIVGIGYGLSMPATTMSKADCGYKEHSHKESCYAEGGELNCGLKEHTHTDECYDSEDFIQTLQVEDTAMQSGGPILRNSGVPNGDVDFQDKITYATVDKFSGGHWTPVTGNPLNVSLNDQLRFNINYSLPAGTLSEANQSIVCALPNGITVKEGAHGYVIGPGNSTVGEYTISGGKIHITFTPEEAKENYPHEGEPGRELDGWITFEGKVDETNIGDNGRLDVKFNDSVNLPLYFEDHTVSRKDDLTVTKTQYQSEADKKAGLVKYTVTVTSKNGTSNSVTVNDIMTGMKIEGNIAVAPSGATATPNQNKDGFTATIPAMSQNQSYTFTYYAKPSQIVNGTVTGTNKVTATTITQDGTKVKDEAEQKTTFTQDLLKKTGQYNAGNNTISWTVTVNESKQNIGGWTLSDNLNGKPLPENVKVTITPDVKPVGQESSQNGQYTLPITFPSNSNQTYTITYTTPAMTDQPMGGAETKNEAILKAKDEDGGGSVSTGQVGGGDGKPNFTPLSKVGGEVELGQVTGGKVPVTVNWTVKIDATDSAISKGFEFTDRDSQDGNAKRIWYTREQLQAVEDAIAAEAQRLNISYTFLVEDGKQNWAFVDINDLEPADKDYHYYAYKVVFPNGIPKDTVLEYTYQTTSEMTQEEAAKTQTFKNKLNSNNKDIYGTATYEPPKNDKLNVIKTDGNGTIGNTSHEIEKNGEIAWNIDITVPSDYDSGDLTIKELLPDGVTLKEIKFYGKKTYDNEYGFGYYGKELSFNNSSTIIYYQPEPLTINHTYNQADNKFELTVPEEFLKRKPTTQDEQQFIHNYKQENNQQEPSAELVAEFKSKPILKEIHLEVKVTPKLDDPSWTDGENGTKVNSLGNKAEIWNDGGKIDEGEHTQDITIKSDVVTPEEPEETVLSKTHAEPNKGEVPYEITINTAAEDLVEGSDEIHLQDILKFGGFNENQDVSMLVLGSVHVYYLTTEGTKGEELPYSAYTYNYKKSYAYSNYTHEMNFTLPDETAMLVTYTYKFVGNVGDGSYAGVSNTARLWGDSGNIDSKEDHASVLVQNSSAGVGSKGIELYKVDGKHEDHGLEGAEFKVYKYIGENGGENIDSNYQVIRNQSDTADMVYRTNDKGIVNIPDLDYNTAYYLLETKPPDGYKQITDHLYFSVENSNVTVNPVRKPDGFVANDLKFIGHILYVPNERIDVTSITVNKLWQDSDGLNKVVTDGEIKVQLKQSTNGTDWNNYGSEVTIKADSAKNWTHTFSNLPTKDDGENEYLYKVEEISVDGFDVSYDDKNNNNGIENGTITITNKEQHTNILPSTGGSGTHKYIIGGICLIAGAFAMLIYKKAYGKREGFL